jgi:hypothetical protein
MTTSVVSMIDTYRRTHNRMQHTFKAMHESPSANRNPAISEPLGSEDRLKRPRRSSRLRALWLMFAVVRYRRAAVPSMSRIIRIVWPRKRGGS